MCNRETDTTQLPLSSELRQKSRMPDQDDASVTPCFTPGTLIATPRGEIAVQDLKVGDKVLTRDNGIQDIRWIGKKHIEGRDLINAYRI